MRLEVYIPSEYFYVHAFIVYVTTREESRGAHRRGGTGCVFKTTLSCSGSSSLIDE